MNDIDVLDKASVRGKRSNRGSTQKKFVNHKYDDESSEHIRKSAGKKGHSRFYDSVDEGYDIDEDSPYADMIDPKMIK